MTIDLSHEKDGNTACKKKRCPTLKCHLKVSDDGDADYSKDYDGDHDDDDYDDDNDDDDYICAF